MLRSLDRNRPLVHVPTPLVSRSLRLLETAMGSRAFATWDEAELMEVSMASAEGSAGAERFGVSPGAHGRRARGGLSRALGGHCPRERRSLAAI